MRSTGAFVVFVGSGLIGAIVIAGIIAAIYFGSGADRMKRVRQRPPEPLRANATVGGKRAPSLPGNVEQRQMDTVVATDNWLVYGGNHMAWRYSGLTQINKANAAYLKVAWYLDTGMHDAFECSPIVVDGTMYVTTPWNHVYALNAATGEVYWHYVQQLENSLALCCGAVNRGPAVGAGKVFFGTLDGHLVALDAVTGQPVWDVKVADKEGGYSITVAPQVIGEKVLISVSGGDFGCRAFVDAYDTGAGDLLWRFWSIPGPGEFGHETWAGDSWQHGGGAVWAPVTYDQNTNTIFLGVGNPGPDLDGRSRKGANLFTECTVAVDGDTGTYKWHYQQIPHDVWDLDTSTECVLADIPIDGQTRRIGMYAHKNGYFYVNDRDTGAFIYALPYCHQINWGYVDGQGRAVMDAGKMPVKERWTKVAPGASGGKEWVPMAYDPQKNRVFIPAIEVPHLHLMMEQEFVGGKNYWGGVSIPEPGTGYGHICAIDVANKRIAWDVRTEYPMVCGITCTASGLIITGTPDQKMLILDADDGSSIFTFQAPSGWHSGPVVYAVNGREYIAFANGWGGWVAGFDDTATPQLGTLPSQNVLFAFTLPDELTGAGQPTGGGAP